MIKHCIICGAAFQSPPSAKKVTCSPACRSIRAAQSARTVKRTWSQEAKARRSVDPAVIERMEQLQSIGVAAALSLPEGQRGEQNRESKTWELIDPSGNHIVVKNLLDWSRRNYTLFEPDDADPEKAAMRISSGFKAISSSMRGVKSRQRPASTYKGWSLAALPIKEDTHDD